MLSKIQTEETCARAGKRTPDGFIIAQTKKDRSPIGGGLSFSCISCREQIRNSFSF